MAIGLLGRKVGMTQIFDEAGRAIPVTVIQAGPCHVLQLRTTERDGYEAIQLGYLDKSRERATRAERGHVARLESKRQKLLAAAGIQTLPKANCEPKRYIKEFRHPIEGYSVGQVLTVELFKDVAAVDVTGTTKGRGFSGVVKRHGYAGQRASHGVKKVHRHPGSTGCNTSPGRVVRGRRMAGHYGHERCTIRNLKVIKIYPEDHVLLVRGAVPGPVGGVVLIRPTNKVG
ncbi:MAG: 50S ribosomal protein L3 [Thermogutta sp.]